MTWWCLRRRRRSRAGSETTGGGTVPGVTGRVVGGGLVSPMSEEATSDGVSRSGRFGGGGGQDYFGARPALGPYSDTPSASGVTTPGVERGGVPLQPNEPGDIAVPVEIDSRLTREERGVPDDLVVTPDAGAGQTQYQEHDDAQERFELYGSEVGSPGLPPPDARELPTPPEERPGQQH